MATALPPVHAHRYIAVLEETFERLMFLGSITPDVLAHRDELSQSVGDEITRIISHQRELEEKYEKLIARRFELKGHTNKSAYKENQIAIQEVSRALRESTKNLCRNLKENPNISGNLLKIQSDRAALSELVEATIADLAKLAYPTLAKVIDEDRREQQHLEDIIAREKATIAAVQKLEEDIKSEKAAKETELKERQKEIASLKEQLHDIKTKIVATSKYERKEATAKLASTHRQYEANEKAWRVKLDALIKHKEMEDTVHRETVDFLNKKQIELSKDTKKWSEKLEIDVEMIDSELKEATRSRETDLEHLNKLKARRDKDMADEIARQAELAHAKELERLRKIQETTEKSAARKILRCYLAYRKRKAEKAAAKKGKSGKSKSKKK